MQEDNSAEPDSGRDERVEGIREDLEAGEAADWGDTGYLLARLTALEQENEQLKSRISEFIEGERVRENYD